MIKVYTTWPTTGGGAGGFGNEITPDFPEGFTFNSVYHSTNGDTLTVDASTFSGFTWTGWVEE